MPQVNPFLAELKFSFNLSLTRFIFQTIAEMNFGSKSTLKILSFSTTIVLAEIQVSTQNFEYIICQSKSSSSSSGRAERRQLLEPRRPSPAAPPPISRLQDPLTPQHTSIILEPSQAQPHPESVISWAPKLLLRQTSAPVHRSPPSGPPSSD